MNLHAVSELSKPFYDRLSDEAKQDLRDSASRRRYPAASPIFFEGDSAHETLVIDSGQVKVVMVAADGREVILSLCGPGSLLGEIASLDGGPRSASVVALTEVDVLTMARSTFDDFLRRHPEALRVLALALASGLREISRRQLEFGTGDSLGRLCARLVELADRFGTVEDDGRISIESPLGQAELGSWSGLSREAIVKSLRTLRSLGWIENDGRWITLIEPDEIYTRASG